MPTTGLSGVRKQLVSWTSSEFNDWGDRVVWLFENIYSGSRPSVHARVFVVSWFLPTIYHLRCSRYCQATELPGVVGRWLSYLYTICFCCLQAASRLESLWLTSAERLLFLDEPRGSSIGLRADSSRLPQYTRLNRNHRASGQVYGEVSFFCFFFSSECIQFDSELKRFIILT